MAAAAPRAPSGRPVSASSPLGRSTASTGAPAGVHRRRPAPPPRRSSGRSRPAPNSASMTSAAGGQRRRRGDRRRRPSGRGRCAASPRSRAGSPSSATVTARARRPASRRAATKPSPPLLPGPATHQHRPVGHQRRGGLGDGAAGGLHQRHAGRAAGDGQPVGLGHLGGGQQLVHRPAPGQRRLDAQVLGDVLEVDEAGEPAAAGDADQPGLGGLHVLQQRGERGRRRRRSAPAAMTSRDPPSGPRSRRPRRIAAWVSTPAMRPPSSDGKVLLACRRASGRRRAASGSPGASTWNSVIIARPAGWRPRRASTSTAPASAPAPIQTKTAIRIRNGLPISPSSPSPTASAWPTRGGDARRAHPVHAQRQQRAQHPAAVHREGRQQVEEREHQVGGEQRRQQAAARRVEREERAGPAAGRAAPGRARRRSPGSPPARRAPPGSPAAGRVGIDSSSASPPIGSRVMCRVPMPKRRAVSAWPYSCSTTQRKSRRISARPAGDAGEGAGLGPVDQRDPGEQQQEGDVHVDVDPGEAAELRGPSHGRRSPCAAAVGRALRRRPSTAQPAGPDRSRRRNLAARAGIGTARGRRRPPATEDRMTIRNLEFALHPRSVAVFGASRAPGLGRRGGDGNILRGGFEGPVWPVNPEHAAVMGLPCFAARRRPARRPGPRGDRARRRRRCPASSPSSARAAAGRRW